MGRESFLTKRLAERGGDLEQLKEAVRDYLSEVDNPVPDAIYRRFLRNRLRGMVDAPPEPPIRRT